jgi:pyrroloquinoline quinone biosynthesis protein D
MSDKIKSEDVYVRNPHFRFQYEEAQGGYVLLFPEGMVKLNGGAGEVLSRLDGNKTVAALVEELKQAFPDTPGLEQDVLDMLAFAIEKTWIEKS